MINQTLRLDEISEELTKESVLTDRSFIVYIFDPHSSDQLLVSRVFLGFNLCV